MKRYKIIDKDAIPAFRWIENQIKNLVGYFPVNSIDAMGANSKAHDTFSKLKPNDACKALHDRLKSKQWVLYGNGNRMIAFKQFPASIDPLDPMHFLFLTQ